MTIDKAQWGRFSNKSDRCRTCNEPATIVVKISARPIGQKGGQALAEETMNFCETHGLQRYTNADKALTGR